jgi:hypothetical protein
MQELQEWTRKNNPVMMQIRPAPGTDDHNYGQLVKLLREKGYVGRLYARQVVHSPS